MSTIQHNSFTLQGVVARARMITGKSRKDFEWRAWKFDLEHVIGTGRTTDETATLGLRIFMPQVDKPFVDGDLVRLKCRVTGSQGQDGTNYSNIDIVDYKVIDKAPVLNAPQAQDHTPAASKDLKHVGEFIDNPNAPPVPAPAPASAAPADFADGLTEDLPW